MIDLRITYGGDSRDNDEVDGRDRSTNLSNSDSSLLAEWHLPELRRLSMVDIIPTKMYCPTLQECRMSLGENRVSWDLRALKDFFRCTPNLESLSFSFDSAPPTESDSDDEMLIDSDGPVGLCHLTSLLIYVGGGTEGAFLKDVLDSLDVSSVSCLKISMRYEFVNQGSLEFYADDWLFGILRTNFDHQRDFKNVKDFQLSLCEDRDEHILPYTNVMRSIPQVQNIVLNVPGCREPSFREIFKHFGDLRSVRLVGCNSFSGSNLLDALEWLNRQQLERIERLEIERCQDMSEYKIRLEKWLGGKLVWKE